MDTSTGGDNPSQNVIANKSVRPNSSNVPPIMLSAVKNYSAHIKFLNQKFNKKLICRPANGGEIIRIHPETIEEYRQIVQYFAECNLQYYVLPHRDTKPYKVVIRGLVLTTDCEEIKNELTELGFDVIRVTQMFSRKSDRMLPLFQVHIRRVGDFQEILTHTILMYLIVFLSTKIFFCHIIQRCR